ncbi:probable ATP-dependent RNA helicase Dbp73D [Orussus abietinus]|uniref:probable ATP-dependent RNA helicase Dbp73D n=1 Tax=Orussus abietinus TaxID=222816 RepID=UPI000625C6AD|nr:probable ATP-dependent RNA helicase Dbp73D [Orussus abietinus]
MSLFVVNTYQGEEQVQSETSNHLSTLLQKIEERKKRRSGAKENTLDVKSNGQVDIPTPAKKRRIKNALRKKNSNITNKKIVPTSDQLIAPSNEKDVRPKDSHKFVVLGSESHKKQRAVKRILPDWLAHPEVISTDLNSGPDLTELTTILDDNLIKVLKKNGIKKLFPVQHKVITWLNKSNKERTMGWWPRDVCVSAPTGSGKTLAYVLPIVQALQTRLVQKVRCLVVLPVKELATQVYKVISKYLAHTNLNVTLLSGVLTFKQEQSNLVRKTENGEYISRVDIVVATPGHLIDHIEKTVGFSLDALRFLVIDEADRATDWLQHLPPHCLHAPPLTTSNVFSSSSIPTQKLLFSATLSQDPEKISRLGLFQPILFTSVISDKDEDVNLDKEVGNFIGRYTVPDELTERVIECSATHKPLVLLHLLSKSDPSERSLVFTNSGKMAHRLTILLRSFLKEENISVGELSANFSPKQREAVLKSFADGNIQVLVSSDALARGVDIPGIKLVVSYDLPKYIEGYIHRAGRTGRAGTPGTAISVLTPNQVGAFNKMLKSARKTTPKFEKLELEALAESIDYEKHLEMLKDTLQKEQSEYLERRKAIKRKR